MNTNFMEKQDKPRLAEPPVGVFYLVEFHISKSLKIPLPLSSSMF